MLQNKGSRNQTSLLNDIGSTDNSRIKDEPTFSFVGGSLWEFSFVLMLLSSYCIFLFSDSSIGGTSPSFQGNN